MYLKTTKEERAISHYLNFENISMNEIGERLSTNARMIHQWEKAHWKELKESLLKSCFCCFLFVFAIKG